MQYGCNLMGDATIRRMVSLDYMDIIYLRPMVHYFMREGCTWVLGTPTMLLIPRDWLI